VPRLVREEERLGLVEELGRIAESLDLHPAMLYLICNA